MENYIIADSFSLLSKLMEIHGENSFKSKSYASAAFAIEKLQVKIQSLPPEKISGINGIGSSSAQKIIEFLQNGKIKVLEDLLLSTPSGIIEMLQIKGIGPKKINIIWKEMGIETIGELLYACKENRLKLYKGFGEKTQQNIIDSIEFYFKHKESHLYAHAALTVSAITSVLEKLLSPSKFIITGKFARQMEVIDALEYITEATATEIEATLEKVEGFQKKNQELDALVFSTAAGIDIILYPINEKNLQERSILGAASPEFGNALLNLTLKMNLSDVKTEEDYFSMAGLPFITAPRREDPAILELAKTGKMTRPIENKDIRGLIHCHSSWSDGGNTLEEMAAACIKKGLDYMVISDHSKSAFYAQGLNEERIISQQEQIELLNSRLKPFRIFKSIECDILNDGRLDYSDPVLATFDLVIASVHSNLKMPIEKAMLRLLTAIENPYTTILGHMTGRLLLSRNGYPLDHNKIIDACAANKVAIELNANPNRLDIDWRHIDYALSKGVYISINPDAHSIEGINDTYFGVLQAQKTMLTKEMNLSSFNLASFERYIADRRIFKGI